MESEDNIQQGAEEAKADGRADVQGFFWEEDGLNKEKRESQEERKRGKKRWENTHVGLKTQVTGIQEHRQPAQ